MAKSYLELLEEDFARQIVFLNIKKYHDMGYKGKGFTVLNAEPNRDHRIMTTNSFKDYAPDTRVLEGSISAKTSGDRVEYCNVNLDNEAIDLEEAIDKYNIKAITRSQSGTLSIGLLKYLKDIQERKGVIFVNSSGNESDEVGVWNKYDTAIAVSACKLMENGEIRLYYYGGKSAELGEIDFTCFMARGTGTSAAAPALAALIVLLLNKYGDFNQKEVVEILKSITYKLPNVDDNKQGWGLPILPLTDKLEILEKMRGENMDFKDVESDRWSKPAIDRCVDEGLLIGFEDGTFRPTEFVTREQFAQILVRIIDKIEGRI